MNLPRPQPKLRSLADYLIRYDLKTMIEQARLDYSQSSAGTPRLLDQKEIAARFRKPPPETKAPHE
jgi:hypothetical protein